MIDKHERILIVNKEGCSIYGRVIGVGGKLGLFEVFSDYWKSEGSLYHQYADAEAQMERLLARTKKSQKN